MSLLKMPLKLRSKIILESYDSVSDAIKAAHEGLVRAMVEQLEKNAANFLQEEYASNSPIEQEEGIGNVDVDTHVLNVVEFQVLINKLKKHNTLAAQHFDERMVAQMKAQAEQIKF